MIALAVLSVLLAGALPNRSQALAAHQLRAASGDLLAAVNNARAQALARRHTVTLLALNGDWRQGWLLVDDRNGNGAADPGETLLARHGAAPERLQIRSRFSDTTAAPYVSYNAAGRSCRAGHPNAANFGTISLELDGAQRNIKINMQGRARLCDPAREPDTCAGVAP